MTVLGAASAHKLRLAGADQVVSPVEMGAQRMVADAIEPSIGSFLDAALHDESVSLALSAIRVGEQPPDLASIESSTGARVIGVQNAEGRIVGTEVNDRTISAGQLLFVAGHPDELAALQALIEPDPNR